MIEVHSERILNSPPGIVGVIAEARLVDKSRGKKISELGLEVWAWDKLVTLKADSKEEARNV